MTSIPREWQKKPPKQEEIPEGVFILLVDAGYKRGITGISTIIKTKDKEYTPKEYPARSKGPVHAELTAIKKGLQSIRGIKKPIELLVVYTDNKYGYKFLVGEWSPDKSYIKSVMTDICKLANSYSHDITYINVKGKYIRRVDRRSINKRKSEESKKEAQIRLRVMKIDEAIKRSRNIEIKEINDEYLAISGSDSLRTYPVSIKPLSCGCSWWFHKWANKSYSAINARALPCKHICALADYLNRDIYAVFRKQIERTD
jgi:ribonuclease HI